MGIRWQSNAIKVPVWAQKRCYRSSDEKSHSIAAGTGARGKWEGHTEASWQRECLSSAPGDHLPPGAGHRRADVLTSPRTPRHLFPQRPCRERLGFPRTEGKRPQPPPHGPAASSELSPSSHWVSLY